MRNTFLIAALFLGLSTASHADAPHKGYDCESTDGSIQLHFDELVTRFGMRSYVRSGEKQYHVFTKPFSKPRTHLLGALVSYINPSFLHVKFPVAQSGSGFSGTAHICMGDFCPGWVPVVCDESLREFFKHPRRW